MIIIKKNSEQTFIHEFGSNIEDCDTSSEGKLVSVARLSPDNSIYCFDLQHKKLLWKYKNYARRMILKLQFYENNIGMYTGHDMDMYIENLSTFNISYLILVCSILSSETKSCYYYNF